MTLIGTVGAAVIISVLGTTVPAYCEHGDRGDKQDKHENHSEHERSSKWEKHPGKQPERAPERVAEQHRSQRPEHGQQGNWHVRQHPEHRVVWKQRRAHEWASE